MHCPIMAMIHNISLSNNISNLLILILCAYLKISIVQPCPEKRLDLQPYFINILPQQMCQNKGDKHEIQFNNQANRSPLRRQ